MALSAPRSSFNDLPEKTSWTTCAAGSKSTEPRWAAHQRRICSAVCAGSGGIGGKGWSMPGAGSRPGGCTHLALDATLRQLSHAEATMPAALVECVPNFSEGRDRARIKQITDAIEAA